MESEEISSHGWLNFGWRNFIIILAVLLIAVIGYSIVFGYRSCDSWDCFNDNLEKCNRARFIGGSDMIFEYFIKGASGDKCDVEVVLLRGNLNKVESDKLEGLDMVCSLPKGVVMIPEGDVDNCHGLLKEGLQDLIIEKLHSYLVENVGKINLEML